jgi:hypothetical protein
MFVRNGCECVESICEMFAKRSVPSFDSTPLQLQILNSPDYIQSKPQLNHLFLDNEYFSEPWHSDSFMNVNSPPHNLFLTFIFSFQGKKIASNLGV